MSEGNGAGRPAAELVDPREAYRRALMPDTAAITAAYEDLARQSAAAQVKARKSADKVRREVFRRLAAAKKDKTGKVEPVSNGDLLRLAAVEADAVKSEAMAQRSYKLSTMVPGGAATNDPSSYEAFILANAVAEDGG